MTNELKKCPFCGSGAEMHFDKICGTTIYMVKCSVPKCQCQEMGWHEKEDEAIAIWNTRQIEDALQARIAELEAENANLNDWLTAWKESLNLAQAEIAKLESIAITWHKYPDEKPIEFGRYAIHRRHNVTPRIDVRYWTGNEWRDKEDAIYDRDIAFWAYLPSPPKEEE